MVVFAVESGLQYFNLVPVTVALLRIFSSEKVRRIQNPFCHDHPEVGKGWPVNTLQVDIPIESALTVRMNKYLLDTRSDWEALFFYNHIRFIIFFFFRHAQIVQCEFTLKDSICALNIKVSEIPIYLNEWSKKRSKGRETNWMYY